MKWATFFLLALALGACVAPPASTPISPLQAGAIVLAATETAAVAATSQAHATATEQVARSTSTAAAQLTRDALSVEATRQALTILADEATARSVSTAQAQASAQAAVASQSAATVVANATSAKLALEQVQQSREAAAARGQFFAAIGGIVVEVLRWLGISFIVWMVLRALSFIALDWMRHSAEIAKGALQLLPPAHWAEWNPISGYTIYPLPGRLDAPATVIENPVTSPSQVHAWRHALRQFCWWGEQYGFGIRDLGPSGAAVVTDPAWRDLVDPLRQAGVLADVVVPGKPGRTTGWASGQTYATFSEALGAGRYDRYLPTDRTPPAVEFTVPTTIPQRNTDTTTTQDRIIVG